LPIDELLKGELMSFLHKYVDISMRVHLVEFGDGHIEGVALDLSVDGQFLTDVVQSACGDVFDGNQEICCPLNGQKHPEE
jgi:hypothetical protein